MDKALCHAKSMYPKCPIVLPSLNAHPRAAKCRFTLICGLVTNCCNAMDRAKGYEMKILVFSSLAYSLVNFRGALLTSLRDQGHDVVAVAPDYDADVASWLAERGIRFETIAMDRTGVGPLNDLKTIWGYIGLIYRGKPDLILAYTQKPIIYGGLAARIAGGVPFYAMMSGLGYLFSSAASERKLVRSVFLRLYREGVRNAKKIFVFNRDDHADMLAASIVTARHDVVQVPGSGVDTSQFTYSEPPIDAPHFLMIGRLMRDKGVYEFVEAARRVKSKFPRARFSILGRAETANPTGINEAEVERLTREYPVEFLAETTDVRPHLASSSVFVLPSYYREGLPRTILEAMASGRAVITTDMPGCRDPIEHGKNGLIIPPQDVDALRVAMEHFLSHPQQIVEMGIRSRAIAEQVYDVTNVNRILMEHMGLTGTTASKNAKPAGDVHRGVLAVEQV